MKKAAGNNMTILGSGSLVSLLTEHNLIDEYQFIIDPVALGEGTPLFKGIKNKLNLKLTGTKVFKNGVVLLSYQPVK
jgi:dihydrofolate reductase